MSPTQARPDPAARVVILGLMGSGKTTLGRSLARHLGWPMHDSDDQLRRSTGQTAREIRDAVGTDALHAAEAQALLEALAEPGPAIIGAAASTIEDAAARAALNGPGVIAVWLRVSPSVLAARFGGGRHRPVYGPDPETVARDQARVRDPLFSAVHPIEIGVDGRSKGEIVEAALAQIRERLRQAQPPG